jgi:hypothetical protein
MSGHNEKPNTNIKKIYNDNCKVGTSNLEQRVDILEIFRVLL